MVRHNGFYSDKNPVIRLKYLEIQRAVGLAGWEWRLVPSLHASGRVFSDFRG